MRHLSLLLLFFLSSFLSAQCFISVSFLESECTAGGDSLYVNFTVQGGGAGLWASPTLGVSGAYNTGEVYSAGPFANDAFTTILFQDSDIGACFNVYDTPLPDCPAPGCENFSVWITSNTDIPACSPEAEVYVSGLNGVVYPLVVEIVDSLTGEVVLVDTIRTPNGRVYGDLPSGTYRVTVTSREGCSITETVDNSRGEGCGNFNGRSWRDANEDGVINDDDDGVFASVQLLRDGVVVQEVLTTFNGQYGFYSLPVGDYQIRFLSDGGFLPTIKDATGGGNDSDANPGTGTTDVLTVPPGGTSDTVNVGWVRTPECSEFELNVGLSPNQQGCSTLGDYVAFVNVAAYPLDFYLLNVYTRDTLGTVTLTEAGEAIIPVTVPGTYTIGARDAAGCAGERTITAFNFTAIPVTIEEEGSACSGTGGVSLTAVAITDRDNLGYLWSNGATTQTITGLEINTNYSVTVTDLETGCTGQQQRIIIDVPNDSIGGVFFPQAFVIGCEQDSVLIEPDTVLSGYTYRWFGPLNTVYEGPSFYATFAGRYFLEAFNASGCFITGIAQVENLSLAGQFIELFEWSQDSSCRDIICFGLETSVFLGEGSPFTIVWEGPDEAFNQLANNSTENTFCGVNPGLYRVTITSVCDTVRRSLFIEEQPECNSVSGTLWVDQAADCGLDPEDTRVPRYVVTLTNQDDGAMYYAITDLNGNWTANVPLGVYEIEPSLDPLTPFGVCPPAIVTLGDFPLTGIQLFLPVENACAQLSTSATMPFLRRCFSSQAFVQYENRGSATATDAELVVVLDDFFDNVVPDRPFTSRDGNTFTFDLGNLDPFATGTIRFNFVVSCQATLGQAHCIEASIRPDEPCVTDENWGGALVRIDAVGCDGDSVRFDISNIGLDQMSIPLTYIIIEDGIMLSPDPYVNGLLLPNETMPVVLPSTGSTYQVVTNQEPDAPAFEDPTAVVEGCNNGSGNTSTGFTNILPLNDGLLTSTTVCRENVGSYDPNDKTGYPLGFGDNNGIQAGTRLDFAIRFQNTGTDTAFTVVIRDTLPAELDLATLKLDAASHDFVATLDSQRVLTFVFENILLPDSTTNLAESQGVVQFSIDHDPTLLPGSIIRNEAAIYFDFNEPIITNKTRHVISKDGLPTGTRAVAAQQVVLSVFPNPTGGVLNVRVPLAEVGPEDKLQVTDLYGRTLAATTYARASAGWNLRHLPAGYYLVVITDVAGRPRGRTGFVVAR